MTPAPCITVLITLYNYEHWIGDCLESVARSQQDDLPAPIEVIVVDDASTDHSANHAERELARLKLPGEVVRNLHNGGPAQARNIGFLRARAPFVFVLDADNIVFPRALTLLYRAITNSNFAAVYGILQKVDAQTNHSLGLLSAFEWDVARLVEGPYIDAMALFRRDAVLNVNGYAAGMRLGWEDYDLWLRLARAEYSCHLVPEIVGRYRMHPRGVSRHVPRHQRLLHGHFVREFGALSQKYPATTRRFGFPHSGPPNVVKQVAQGILRRLTYA